MPQLPSKETSSAWAEAEAELAAIAARPLNKIRAGQPKYDAFTYRGLESSAVCRHLITDSTVLASTAEEMSANAEGQAAGERSLAYGPSR
jgi:hypothetical protein